MIAVVIYSAKGKKVAGTVELNLAEVLQKHRNDLQGSFKLSKCPDPNAEISLKVDLTKMSVGETVQSVGADEILSQYNENSMLQMTFVEGNYSFTETGRSTLCFDDDGQGLNLHETTICSFTSENISSIDSVRSKVSEEPKPIIPQRNSITNSNSKSKNNPFGRKEENSTSIVFSSLEKLPLQDITPNKQSKEDNLSLPKNDKSILEQLGGQSNQNQIVKQLTKQLEEVSEENRSLKARLQENLKTEQKMQNEMSTMQRLCNEFRSKSDQIEILLVQERDRASKAEEQELKLKEEVAFLETLSKDLRVRNEINEQNLSQSVSQNKALEQRISEMELEFRQYKVEAEEQVSLLKSERESITSDLEELQKRYTCALQAATAEKDPEASQQLQTIKKLEFQCVAYREENMRISDELKQKTNELEVSKKEIHQHFDELENLRNRIRDLQEQIVEAKIKSQEEMKMKACQIDDLQTEIGFLTVNYEALKKDRRDLELTIEDCKKDNAILIDQIDQITLESEERIRELTAECNNLKQLASQETEALRMRLQLANENYEKQHEEKENEKSMLETTIKQLRALNEELKVQAASHLSKDECNVTFRGSTGRSTQCSQEGGTQDPILTRRVQTLEEENTSLRQKLDELERNQKKPEEKTHIDENVELILLRDQKDVLLLELVSLKAELFETKSELKRDISTELIELREKVQNFENEKQTYERELASLKDIIKSLEREKNSKAAICKRQQEQFDFENKQRQGRDTEMRANVELQEKKRLEAEQLLFEVKSNYGKLKSEYDILQFNMSCLEAEIQALKEERDQLKKKNELILDDSERTQRSLSQLSLQRSTENVILQSAEEKFIKVKEFNEKLAQTLKKAESENQELKDEVHRLELLLREKESLIINYANKIEDLQASAEVTQSEYGKETSRLQEQARKLDEMFESLKRDKRLEIERLKTQRQEAEEETQTYKTKNLELIETIETLKQRITELQDQLSSFEDSSAVTARFKQANKEIEYKYKILQDDFEKQKVDDTITQNSLRVKIESQSREIDALGNTIQRFKSEMSKSQSTAQQRESELINKYRSLEDTLFQTKTDYNSQVAKLEADVEIKAQSLVVIKNSLDQVKKELEMLSVKYSELEIASQNNRSGELQSKIEMSETLLEIQNKQVLSLKDRVKRLEEELDCKNDELKTLIQKNKNINEKLAELSKNQQDPDEVENYCHEIETLRKAYSTANEENVDLQVSLENTAQQLQNTTKQLQKRQEDLANLEKILQESQDELVMSKQKLGNVLNSALEYGGPELMEKLYSSLN